MFRLEVVPTIQLVYSTNEGGTLSLTMSTYKVCVTVETKLSVENSYLNTQNKNYLLIMY